MPTLQMPGQCDLVLPENASVDMWHYARTTGVGGSEVAALLGSSPYATAFDVFRSKVDDDGKPKFKAPPPAATKRVRPELLTDDPVFEWGHRLEEAVALKTADELNLVARSGNGLWRHREHPLAIVTPDRVATKRRSLKPVALIECKTSAGTWEDDEAPLQYEIQAQWQMGITGINTCYLGCFVLSYEREYHLVKLDFDANWFAEMVEVVETFWEQHVLTGEPPMHDFKHPRTSELLKELHPRVAYEATQLPDEAEEWVQAYHAAKAAEKYAKEQLDEIKNWLRFHLGDAAGGYIGEQKVVSYPEVKSRRLLVKKVRELDPDLAEQCTEETVHRRMTVRKYTRPRTAA